jgi:heme-degrading monooxygenase HmoA
MADGDSFASGNWFVSEGNEDEFVARWTDFLEWTRDNADGFRGASLLRSRREQGRFVSIAQWEDYSNQEGWRAKPEFAEKFGACRELCDDVQAGSFERVVSI